MTKKKLVALLLVICLAVSLVLTGCGDQKSLTAKEVEKDPLSYLQKGGEIVEKAWSFGDGQLDELVQRVMEKGQVALHVDMTNCKLDNVLSIDGDKISNDLTGNFSGQDVDLMFYADKTDLALRSNMLLGNEDTYGLNLDTFFEQGTESNLAKLFGLEQAALDEMKELLQGEDDSENLLETYEQKLKDMEADIEEILEKADITAAEEKVKIEETEVNAIKVSIPITNELKKAVMDSVMEIYKSMMEGMDNADLESIEELQSMMEEIDMTGTYDYYLNQETGALMQVNADFTMTMEGEEEKIAETVSVVYGADPAASNKITMDATAKSDDEEVVKMNAVVSKEVKDKSNALSFDFTMDADGETITCKITGTASVEKDRAEFKIDSIKANDVTVDTDISIKLSADTDALKKPEYQDLLTMDDAALTNLFMAISQNLQTVTSGDLSMSTSDEEGTCNICGGEATQEVDYLGTTWNVCDDCAKELTEIMNGDYCDNCLTQTSDLTVMEQDGVSFRLCSDCYAAIGA